jgi:hypothetical protein
LAASDNFHPDSCTAPLPIFLNSTYSSGSLDPDPLAWMYVISIFGKLGTRVFVGTGVFVAVGIGVRVGVSVGNGFITIGKKILFTINADELARIGVPTIKIIRPIVRAIIVDPQLFVVLE